MTNQREDTRILFSRLLSGALKCIAEFGGQNVPAVEQELSSATDKTLSTNTIERYKSLKNVKQLPHPHDLEKMIPALVKMGIEKGLLNEHWAESLCNSCKYPYALVAPLVQSLLPTRPPENDVGLAQSTSMRLPAPNYSVFIPRPEPYANIMKKLREHKALIVIHGILGSGKRSLATEVARAIDQRRADAPRFDAIIWIGNQGDPDPLTFTHILDTILETLDYQGHLTITNIDEKEKKVNWLLRSKKVLLIIDNFDSFKNGELRQVRKWLGYLPEQSKAIIITESFTNFELKQQWHSVGDVSLDGLTSEEMAAFIQLHMSAKDIQVANLSQSEEIEALQEATGGNPLAIEIMLADIMRTGSLKSSIAQIPDGKLTFHTYFESLWHDHLKPPAKRLLMIMTLFKASVSAEAIAKVSNHQAENFTEILEQLVNEHLIVKHLSTPPRYSLFPLVRNYAEQQMDSSFKEQARSRWIAWYVALAKQAGWQWNNLPQLNVLDNEIDAIHKALLWLFEHEYYEEALAVGQGVDHYYYIHGHWNLKLEADKIRIKAAQELKLKYEVICALGQYIQFLCRQSKITEAEQRFIELEALTPNNLNYPDAKILVAHAYAFKEMAQHNYVMAQQILEETYRDLVPQCPQDKHLEISTLHWLATCLYQQSLVKLIGHEFDDVRDLRKKAEDVSLQAIELAETHNYQRSIVQSYYTLANICCDRGNWEAASLYIHKGLKLAEEIRERRYLALLQWTEARFYAGQHIYLPARPLLEKALPELDQLNMPEEYQHARELLEHVMLHLTFPQGI